MKSVVFVLIFLLSDLIAEDLVKVNADLRLSYLNYEYEDNWFSDSRAGIASAKLSATTQVWNNLYAKVSFVAVEGINHDKSKQGMSYVFSEGWNGIHDSFALLEESYIGYKNSILSLKVGRQEMELPFIHSDDYFVVPNSFEAMTLEFTPSQKLTLHLGHVSRMSGTWDSSYDGADFHSMSRQAWIHYTNTTKDTYPITEIYNIVGDQGISYAGVIYTRMEHAIQVWDFYAHETFNTIMLQYDYTSHNYYAGLQYSTKRDIGKLKDSPLYRVHYDVYGAKIGAKIAEKWNMELAYTGVSDDDSLHYLGSWGGYSEFASGMLLSYFETYLRDADIYAMASKYTLDNLAKGLSLKFQYARYELNKDYTINVPKESPNGDGYMNAYGVQVFYQYNKNLSLKMAFAGRELENRNNSNLVRAVMKYSF